MSEKKAVVKDDELCADCDDVNELVKKCILQLDENISGSVKIVYDKAENGELYASNGKLREIEAKTEYYKEEIVKWKEVCDTLVKKNTFTITPAEHKKLDTSGHEKRLSRENADLIKKLEHEATMREHTEDKFMCRLNLTKNKANGLIRGIFEADKEEEIDPLIILKALTAFHD